MDILTLTEPDLYDAATNGAYGCIFGAATFATSAVVDVAAHKVFGVKRDASSTKSLAIRAFALIAGLGPAIYFAIQVTLVSFTARKVVEIFLLCLPMHFIPKVNVFTNRIFGMSLVENINLLTMPR